MFIVVITPSILQPAPADDGLEFCPVVSVEYGPFPAVTPVTLVSAFYEIENTQEDEAVTNDR